MRLSELLARDAVVPDLSGTDLSAVLEQLCAPLASLGQFTAQTLARALLEREKLGSTGIGGGVAIPHARVPGYERLRASFGRSAAGLDFKAPDGAPARFIVALIAPAAAAGPHVTALGRISRVFRRKEIHQALANAGSAEEIYRLLLEEDQRTG
jgi:PTS system nitrogen regulatory IIA component